ncbi:MAG: type 1 glutamine amidotransferase [Phycisphaerae bacterium]|nr:type 1 glutamine amidotransferase [Phycisphaerae bacterium]
MAIIVFQHWGTGRPGRVGHTLRDHGFKLDVRTPNLSEEEGGRPVPIDLESVQGVLVLGGPQNVTDADRYPWMRQELDYVRRAHALELPVIGICLGAQMIAHALGGQVGQRERALVGFAECSLTPAGQTEPVLAGIRWRSPQLFCCGQEVKQLPPGAVTLAGNRATPVQAFRAGLRTFGFLFHFECDRPMLDDLLGEAPEMLAAAGVAAEAVRQQADTHYADYARLSDRLCVNLATLCFPFHEKLTA